MTGMEYAVWQLRAKMHMRPSQQVRFIAVSELVHFTCCPPWHAAFGDKLCSSLQAEGYYLARSLSFR